MMIHIGAGFATTILSIYSIYSTIVNHGWNDQEIRLINNQIIWSVFNVVTTLLALLASTSMVYEVWNVTFQPY